MPSPRNPAGPLVNVALLERQLGQVAYRLAKLPATMLGERQRLQAEHGQLVAALDAELAKAAAKGP